MSIEEISEWAGRSSSYITKNKKAWCKNQLSKYAEYKLVRGGVIISKIINPCYNTSGRKEVEEKYYEYWGTENFKVDTNINCWRKMATGMKNQLAESTGTAYVGACRREDYGVAQKRRRREGKRGYCQYVFCKSIEGQAVPFTPEEEEIKKKLSAKYFSNREEEVIEMQALLSDYQKGGISKEEYMEAMTDMLITDKSWLGFQNSLEEAIGCDTDFFIEIIDNGIKIYELECVDDFDF